MSSPKLSLSLAAAVHPWLRFRRAARAAFVSAFQQETITPLTAGLKRGPDTWLEGEETFGWRLEPDDRDAFAFLGLYLGPESVHRECPDLYFFLEVGRGSVEQEAIDARADEINEAIATLNKLGLNVFWGYTPGGTHGVWAVMSLLDAIRSGDAEASVNQFVFHTLSYARDTGLSALFLGEAFAAVPTPEDPQHSGVTEDEPQA